VINLKNIFVGFLISFIGSIPLGYLNVVGFEIFKKQGLQPTFVYLFGVVIIEFLVVYFSLIFAKKLAENKKITRFIEGFSVLFMFVLAVVFYCSANAKSDFSTSFNHPPFVLGIVLSGLNFIQIPFWTGWNVYLLNRNYIEISNTRKYFYVIGTTLGTFSGMLVLILSLNYFASNVDFIAKYLLKIIIPVVFLSLGIFQGIQFYQKYIKPKKD
jgi:hypothetical protein